MRARSMGLTAMVTVVAGAAVMWAAPPVKNLAATATFRNAGDAVTSPPITGTISTIGAFGASVASPAESGTQVTLPDYLAPPNHPVDTRECAVPGVLAGCNPDPQESGVALDLEQFQVGVKPILEEADEYQDRPGGLTGMACSGPSSSSPALVNYTLYIRFTEGHWGLNANPRYHADAATVVRTSRTTWVVTAVGRAELIGFGHSGIVRKGPSHEGQYILPFQITITANAPVSPTCP